MNNLGAKSFILAFLVFATFSLNAQTIPTQTQEGKTKVSTLAKAQKPAPAPARADRKIQTRKEKQLEAISKRIELLLKEPDSPKKQRQLEYFRNKRKEILDDKN